MKRAVCEKSVGAELAKPLKTLGFEQEATLDFLRKTEFGGQTLRFGGRIDHQGHCHISGTAGIIFRDVEAVLAHSGKSGSALAPTIVMPLHLLHAERKYFDWQLQGADDAPIVATDIVGAVKALAQPFFERYGTLTAVRDALAKPSPLSWFILSPEQRETTLAAIEHLLGSSDSAIARLDSALAERAGEMPRRRRELEKLRGHLATVRGVRG